MAAAIEFKMKTEFISSLLYHCSKIKDLRLGVCLHACAVRGGLGVDVVVSNHILNLYAKCGKITLARRLFDEMSERNLVSWSAMISGYDQAGKHFQALELFSNLRLVPNEYVYASAVSACSSVKALEQGRQIHAHSMKHGYDSVSFVSNSLISMYMECGCCDDALLIYDEMSEPNSVSYNALIAGVVENKKGEKGFELYKSMRQQGVLPDRFTFAGLLEICSSASDQPRGLALHCQTIKLKLDLTPFVGNVLITMYSKFCMLEQAKKLFKSIEEKDVVSWNAFIAACYQSGENGNSLNAFRQMLCGRSICPDDFTFTNVLAACAGLALIRDGKQIHAHLIRTRPNQDVAVGNALVNMYAKCGSIKNAFDVFSRMPRRNLVSWNTMIAGLGSHGLGSKALELFNEMVDRGLRPNPVTLIGMLTAFNHAGLVDKGVRFFNSMEETHGIAPDIEHFSCLIDLLGRAGRLIEAEEYMGKYPGFQNDPVALGSLLSACRIHGDKSIGERLAKKLLKLHPETSSSPYVLLSSLYASDEKWDDVAEARKMLKGRGVKKEPGQSVVDVEGRFEKFTKGDFSHLRIGEIKSMLGMLSWAIYEIPLDSPHTV